MPYMPEPYLRAGYQQPFDVRPVLKAWQNTITTYCEREQGDAPYWYNERANVGTFAAAVWLANGIAVEEFRTTKDSGKTFRSRSDLWFKFGETKVLAEAKQSWPGLPGSVANSAVTGLKSAAACIGTPDRRDFDRKLAVQFLSVRITNGNKAAFKADDWRRAAEATCEQHGPAHFTACWFEGPGGDSAWKIGWDDKKRLGFPGVIILGQWC